MSSMIGDSLKGILFLAVIGFALLGAATVLPDSAWEKIPPKLVPVRQYLAEKGVISEKYLKDASEPEMVCSGGVCRIQEKGIAAAEPLHGLESKGVTDSPFVKNDDSPQRDADGLSPFPIDFNPITEESVAEAELIPDDFPDPVAESPRSVIPAPTDSSDSTFLGTLPENFPAKSVTSSDTLPDLQFESDDPGRNHGSSLGVLTPPVKEMTPDKTSSSPFSEITPSSFEAGNDPNLTQGSDSDGHLKSIGRYETENSPFPDPVPLADSPETADPFPSIPSPTADPFDSPNSAPSSPTSPSSPSSVHEWVTDAVAQSERPGGTASAFLKLNDVLNRFDADLSPEDRTLLNRALDRLAFHVFYKPNTHVLWREYSVGPNETLASIARHYKITPEFLAVINSIHRKPDAPLQTGQKLKVVEGPVTADVSFSKMELLLKFNGLYAGRFKMGCARRAEAVRGEFPIVRKIQNPDYNGPIDGGEIGRISGGDPKNPLGPCWIELAGGLGLQGTNRPEYVGQKTAAIGGLIFSNKDISHLNILLAKGSLIRITD